MAELRAGDILKERFRILDVVGEGGFGVVYRAEQLNTQQKVAIKILTGKLDAVKTERFEREMRLLADLSHPNLVQLVDTGEFQDQRFMVLELVEGEELADRLKAGGPLAPHLAKRVISQTLEGLEAAHARGVVHRDIKPQNIMLTGPRERPVVKLLDFGIAAVTDTYEGDWATLTSTGAIQGTVPYMAPELLNPKTDKRRPASPRSDIFAVGLVLIECLSGVRVLEGETPIEIVFKIVQDPLPIPMAVLNGPFGMVIKQACSKEPEERFTSAREMLDALEVVDSHSQEIPVADEILLYESMNLDTRRLGLEDLSETADAPDLEPEPQQEASKLPWVVLGMLVLAAVLGALWFSGRGEDTAAEDPQPEAEAVEEPGRALRVGWSRPAFDEASAEVEVEAWSSVFQQASQSANHSFAMSPGADVIGQLVEGQLDVAVLPPMLYVGAVQLHPEALELLVVGESRGSNTHEGYVLVRRDDDATAIEELAGRPFCLLSEESAAGYVLPRHFLTRSGQSPDDFIGSVRWSGDHVSALRDLTEGLCDAAAVSDRSLALAERAGITRKETRIIAVTGHLPRDVVVAGPSTSPEERARVKQALLGVSLETPVGSLAMTGFQPASDATFDTLRKILNEAKAAAEAAVAEATPDEAEVLDALPLEALSERCALSTWKACRLHAVKLLEVERSWDNGKIAAGELERACSGGDEQACLLLADLLDEGLGVLKDEARASSLRNESCTARNYGHGCYLLGDALLEKGSAAQVAEGVELFQRACELGHLEGCERYGTALQLGKGVAAIDVAAALEVYSATCDKGHASSCRRLGSIYKKGQLAEHDASRTVHFYERACELGDIYSCNELGDIHLTGLDAIAKSPDRAARFFESACELGEGRSCYRLSQLLQRGDAPDLERIEGLLEKACAQGEPKGCK